MVVSKISNSAITTTQALSVTVADTIDATATIIRNETILTCDTKGGVLSYSVEDGAKVAKGGLVAQVYPDQATASAKTQLDYLSTNISSLKALITSASSGKTDIAQTEKQMDENYLSLLAAIDDKNAGAYRVCTQNILNSYNEEQLSASTSDPFKSEVDKLNTQYNDLNAKYGNAISESKILSSFSGYFVSKVDGMENILKVNDSSQITVNLLSSAKPSQNDIKNAVGKIENDDAYYIAVIMDKSQALQISNGSTATLEVPLNTISTIPVSVVAVNDGANNKSCVVFSCNYQNQELSLLRTMNVKVILKQYTGLKVSNINLRTLNNQQGVYVFYNNAAVFKPVNIIYQGDGFVLCKPDSNVNTTGKSLQLYDEVITDGKGIYVGKTA